MTEEIKHYQVNQQYRVVFERAASTKGVIGIKVEANADTPAKALDDALYLFNTAKSLIPNEEVKA